MIYTGGRAGLWMDSELQCEAGDILLIPAGMAHSMRQASDSPQTTAEGVGFFAGPDLNAQSSLNLLAPYDRVRSGGLPVARANSDREPHMQNLLRELERETQNAGPGNDAAARYLLSLLLIEVNRAFQKVHESAGTPRSLVAGALRFIEDHCLRPISLADVADAIGRSPAHVTTAVRTATGKPVLAWIIAGRMHEARQRLLYTDETIESIAEHVGYAEPDHFTRLFRREHNATPKAWRQAARTRRKSD